MMTTQGNSSFNLHFSHLNDPQASATSPHFWNWLHIIPLPMWRHTFCSLFSCDFEALEFHIPFAFLKSYKLMEIQQWEG